jgi:hypothetical protein
MADDSEPTNKLKGLLDAHVAILAAAAIDQNLERALLTKMRASGEGAFKSCQSRGAPLEQRRPVWVSLDHRRRS